MANTLEDAARCLRNHCSRRKRIHLPGDRPGGDKAAATEVRLLLSGLERASAPSRWGTWFGNPATDPEEKMAGSGC
jgi:hypothetical protein